MGLELIADITLVILIVAVWAWILAIVFDAFPDFPHIHEDEPRWLFPKNKKP